MNKITIFKLLLVVVTTLSIEYAICRIVVSSPLSISSGTALPSLSNESVVSFHALMEKHFSRSQSITEAEWNRNLPTENETTQIFEVFVCCINDLSDNETNLLNSFLLFKKKIV